MRKLVLLFVAAAASPAMALDDVSPKEIRATFGTGVPFVSTSPTGKSFMLTLRPDGTCSNAAQGATSGETGKWRIDATGYCSSWEKGLEHCFTVVKDGSVYTVLRRNGGVVARWAPPAGTASPVKK